MKKKNIEKDYIMDISGPIIDLVDRAKKKGSKYVEIRITDFERKKDSYVVNLYAWKDGKSSERLAKIQLPEIPNGWATQGKLIALSDYLKRIEDELNSSGIPVEFSNTFRGNLEHKNILNDLLKEKVKNCSSYDAKRTSSQTKLKPYSIDTLAA